MQIIAEIAKQPAKLDCLKRPSVLALETLEPSSFHTFALIIFALAILHTLLTYRIQLLAENLEGKRQKRTAFIHTLFFISQVEIVFALWTIPLFIAMCFFYDWPTALEYINTRDYTEPAFVVVILALTATRPIVHIAQNVMKWVAKWLEFPLLALFQKGNQTAFKTKRHCRN
jgi:hypothetical protein